MTKGSITDTIVLFGAIAFTAVGIIMALLFFTAQVVEVVIVIKKVVVVIKEKLRVKRLDMRKLFKLMSIGLCLIILLFLIAMCDWKRKQSYTKKREPIYELIASNVISSEIFYKSDINKEDIEPVYELFYSGKISSKVLDEFISERISFFDYGIWIYKQGHPNVHWIKWFIMDEWYSIKSAIKGKRYY